MNLYVAQHLPPPIKFWVMKESLRDQLIGVSGRRVKESRPDLQVPYGI
jgi:hypothetical protein